MEEKESILIVDDDDSTCRTLVNIFIREGYEIEIAGTAQEAIAKAKDKFFNVALLDIKLPDMEGVELITPLKEIHPDISVMMMTGFASVETAVRALNTGATAYVIKPLNMDEVLSIVKKAIDKQYLVTETKRLHNKVQQELIERKLAEKALQEAKEKFQMLVEKLEEGVIFKDTEGFISFVNPKTTEILGYKEEELIGKHWSHYISTENLSKAKAEPKKDPKESSSINEVSVQTKDGPPILITIKTTPIFSKNREYQGTLCVFTDITERKRIENALKKSEERYRAVVETQTEQISRIDPDLKHVFVNEAYCRFFGKNREELIGQSIIFLVPVNERCKIEKYFSTLNFKNPVQMIEHQVINATGEIRWVQSVNRGIFNEEGELVEIQTVGRDITEHKLREEELRKSESNLAEAQRITHLGSWDWNLETKEFFWSDEVYRIFGFSHKELEPSYEFFLSIVHPMDREFVNQSVNDALYKNKPYNIEHRIIKPDGEERIMKEVAEVTYNEKNQPIRMFGTVHDITECAKAARELRVADEKIRILSRAVEQSPGSIMITDIDGKIEYVNPKFYQLTGFSSEEILGNNPRILKSGKTPIEEYERLWEAIKSGNEWHGEFLNKKKNGELYWDAFSISPIKNALGIITHFVAIREDITRRKKAEEELKKVLSLLEETIRERTYDLMQEKNKVKTIIELFPDGILVLEADGKMTLANKAFKELYKEVFKGQPLPKSWIHDEKTGNIFLDTVTEIFYAKKPQSLAIEALPGLHLHIASNIIKLEGEKPLGIIIQLRDITSLVEYDELRKKFVSSVSHELRTPISAIIQSVGNLKKYKWKLKPEQQDKLINMVSRNSSLLSNLIEDLLIISKIEERKISIKWERYVLNDTITDVIGQLEPNIQEKKINIITNVTGSIVLYGDASRTAQIFRILIDNAIKYSDENSTVFITAIDDYIVKDDNGVLVQVIDTGKGIKKKDLPHLFERFYRSDDVKDIHGTGLGLAIAKELLALQGGHITVESKYGKGSTFSVFLPRKKSLI
ncbi:MAG: PAS domain S-box protein [Candidatus Hodarchaeales archaeon]